MNAELRCFCNTNSQSVWAIAPIATNRVRTSVAPGSCNCSPNRATQPNQTPWFDPNPYHSNRQCHSVQEPFARPRRPRGRWKEPIARQQAGQQMRKSPFCPPGTRPLSAKNARPAAVSSTNVSPPAICLRAKKPRSFASSLIVSRGHEVRHDSIASAYVRGRAAIHSKRSRINAVGESVMRKRRQGFLSRREGPHRTVDQSLRPQDHRTPRT